MRPPCANWKVWIGQEIEGHLNLGEKTLFIREVPDALSSLPKETLTRNGTIKRVWFCREFITRSAEKWKTFRKIAQHFETVCIEITLNDYEAIPRDLRDKAFLYLKIPLPLKKGDHVCVGPAFQDESFMVGKGNKISPEQYLNDIKVL
jgi:hypothetical protein